MPASIPVRLAPALQFLGRISYDLTVYNVHSRVFSSMDYSRRNVLDTMRTQERRCVVPLGGQFTGQHTTIRGLTATVEGLRAKIHVLIREIQELAPEGYDLDRLGRLMRTSFTP